MSLSWKKRRIKYNSSSDDFEQAKLISYICLRIDRTIKMSGDSNPSKRPEVRAKMSASAKLRPSNSLGVKRSAETKKKLSDIAKLRVVSEEQKKKTSNSLKGRIPWNKNKHTGPKSIETRNKIAVGRTGKHHTKETKKRISVIKKSQHLTGEKAPRWQGGISFEPYCPKWTPELHERIRAFFNYECLLCGKSTEENGEALCCHHVEYDKQACCHGKPVHFAALCRSCHGKTGGSKDNNRQYWEDIIHIIIYELYNDKSYYTKEEWRQLAC